MHLKARRAVAAPIRPGMVFVARKRRELMEDCERHCAEKGISAEATKAYLGVVAKSVKDRYLWNWYEDEKKAKLKRAGKLTGN